MARAACCGPRCGSSRASPRAAAKRRAPPRAPPQRSSPAPPALQPLAPWSGSDALLRFISDAGGWVHPSLVVGSRGAGRGVFAAQPLPAGPVAYVPCATCITATQAASSSSGLLEALLPSLEPSERLALHLLSRMRSGGDGFTASLPLLADGALVPFPISWSAEQLGALRDPELASQFAARRARAEAQHAALAPTLSISLDEWLWVHAMVLSRALRWHDGLDTCLQPFIDCVNHAPFAASPARNTLYDYVPGGTQNDAALWPGLPAGCAAGGCAALRLLRPVAAGEELLTSYAQEQAGGRLRAQAALARYGFLPDALSGQDASYDVHPAEARHTALELRLSPAFAAAAGARDKQLRCVGSQLATAAAEDDAAARTAQDAPARIAALYRRGRGLALGRAALPHLLDNPRAARPSNGDDGDALDALRAGVAAGIAAAAKRGAFAAAAQGASAAFEAAVWGALAGKEPPLLTPDEAIAAAAAS